MKSYWENRKSGFQLDKQHIERQIKEETDPSIIEQLRQKRRKIAAELEVACIALGHFS